MFGHHKNATVDTVENILSKSESELLILRVLRKSWCEDDPTQAKACCLPRRIQAIKECWMLKDQVCIVLHDRVCRILNIHNNQFYALDRLATKMLLLNAFSGIECMTNTISNDYGVEPNRVASDWRSLVAQLHSASMIVPAANGPVALPSINCITLWLRLTAIRILLFVLGWRTTTSIVHLLSQRATTQMVVPTSEFLAALDQQVKTTATRHFMHMQCKERALVTWYTLRRLGINATLHIGVAFYPFEAHAWTTFNDTTVGDFVDETNYFKSVLTYS